jgi:hypothetical protein
MTTYAQRSRQVWRPTARDFPTWEQLSVSGLAFYYQINYDAVRAFVISLAERRLRRAVKASGRISLDYHEATKIADSDLLSNLHAYGKIQVCREAPPYVVYVR